jgi:UDP-N-acetylmuramoylalanine--D-glutamate ligase
VDLKDKRVLVVGLGKSGAASALFCRERGARVAVSDSKAEPYLAAEIPHLLDAGVVVETGTHGERTFRDQDLIVVSPGVPSDLAQLQQARALGVPVIGEVELAYRFIKGKIVAITGSNGKTTTTTLVGEILKHAGKKVQVGGNIGTPVITLVAGSTAETWNVLEISSFQLETIQEFHPHIAAILNITPDHLDRHHTFEAYVAAKARIFENQKAGDFAVLNADDAPTKALAAQVKGQVQWFSRQAAVERGAYTKDGQIVTTAGSQPLMLVSEIPLKGAHNVENVLAAVVCALLAGCPPEKIRDAVRAFKAVEHRLEFVAKFDGVEYFNDSKATNVDATIKALESFPGNIHIILGGKDKGSDYTVLRPLLEARVKRAYTIGAAAAKIESQIKGAVAIVSAETLDNAIRRAAATAAPGDVILLAPACASFDQFQSYEHRGRVFKEVVQSLAARRAQKVAPDAQGGAA